jgi:Bacteriophage T4-like portal protein (Gp20)
MNEPEQCAFDQRDSEDEDVVVAAFYPWQIVHARLNWDGFSAYGRSHVRVSRSTWKKLRALEEAMVIARLTRAYMKLVFYIDSTGLGPAEKQRLVQDFKRAVQTRGRIDNKRDANFQVMTDFFMTSGYVNFQNQPLAQLSKIDVIDPKNGDLHQIDDVHFLHRKFVSTLRVPPAHMGYERELNAKATLTQQDVQYVRYLRSLQQLVGQALEQVYDTALALRGIDPSTAEYRIAWPMLKATDELSAAQAYLFKAQGDAIYLGASQVNTKPVIDPRWVMEERLDLNLEDIEELEGRLEEQKQQDLKDQQDQAQMQHQQQMELATVKRPAPDSSRGPVANEVKLLRDLRNLLQANGVLGPADIVEDPASGGAPVVNIHFNKGAIANSTNHEHHIDPGAVKVTHHSHVPVTVVNGKQPEDDGEPDQPKPRSQRDEGSPV